jgi:hypothetical protein
VKMGGVPKPSRSGATPKANSASQHIQIGGTENNNFLDPYANPHAAGAPAPEQHQPPPPTHNAPAQQQQQQQRSPTPSIEPRLRGLRWPTLSTTSAVCTRASTVTMTACACLDEVVFLEKHMKTTMAWYGDVGCGCGRLNLGLFLSSVGARHDGEEVTVALGFASVGGANRQALPWSNT